MLTGEGLDLIEVGIVCPLHWLSINPSRRQFQRTSVGIRSKFGFERDKAPVKKGSDQGLSS